MRIFSKLFSVFIICFSFSGQSHALPIDQIQGQYKLYAVPGSDGRAFVPLAQIGMQNIDPNYMMWIMENSSLIITDAAIIANNKLICDKPQYDFLTKNPVADVAAADILLQSQNGVINSIPTKPFSAYIACNGGQYKMMLIMLNDNDLYLSMSNYQNLIFRKGS